MVRTTLSTQPSNTPLESAGCFTIQRSEVHVCLGNYASQCLIAECCLVRTRLTRWSKVCLSRYRWEIQLYDLCCLLLSIGLDVGKDNRPRREEVNEF